MDEGLNCFPYRRTELLFVRQRYGQWHCRWEAARFVIRRYLD